jgi:GNAT superfamily N-acetyltransferase
MTPDPLKVFGAIDSAPMGLPDDLSLRDADPDDLPAIGALRTSVGWSVHEWALRAVIGVPHARCIVAVDGDGTIAGVGSGIVYGPLGFVGNMVVAEAHRRRGVGSAILESVTAFLEAAGCRRLELNATSDGRPLYERHGFASIGRSATARIPRDAVRSRDPTVSVRRAEPHHGTALATYDGRRFGGDRGPLLEMLLDDPAAIVLLADRDGVGLAGYACVRPEEPRIGPMLADEPSVAETLLVEAFDAAPAAGDLRLNLPPDNHPGAEWLSGLGIRIEPWDGRMARGPHIPRRAETIYGMAVGALG